MANKIALLALIVSLAALVLTGRMFLNQYAQQAESSGDIETLTNVPTSLVGSGQQPIAQAEATKVEPPSETQFVATPDATPPSVALPRFARTVPKEQVDAESRQVLARLAQAFPNEARAIHVRAIYHARIFETAVAEELWTRCIELDPNTDVYYVNLAAISIDRGNNELALETLEAAAKRGLDSLDLNHHLGMSLNNVGRSEEAASLMERVLETAPNSAAHWLILGQAQLKLRRTEPAEQNLRKAIDLGAETKQAYFALFNACMRNGKRDEAKQFQAIYQGFDKAEPFSAQQRHQMLSDAEARRIHLSVLSEAAGLFSDSGKPGEAEQLHLQLLSYDPGNQNSLAALAEMYASQARFPDERLVRERIIEVNPTNLIGYLYLAQAEASCDNLPQAEAAIKLAISLAPQMATGYAAMADFLLTHRSADRALWYAQQAVGREPTQETYRLLARTLRFLGREAEAQAAEAAASEMAG